MVCSNDPLFCKLNCKVSCHPMKPFLFLITLLPFVCMGVSAQDADISPLIKAWEVSDTSQTRKYPESVYSQSYQLIQDVFSFNLLPVNSIRDCLSA